MHRVPTLLLVLAHLAAGRVSADEVDLTPYLLPNRDDEWLKRSKVATDPAGLLKFLKSCQGPETPPADVAALVAKLVAGDAAAAKGLAAVGPLALPALRAHMTDPDVAVVKRVRSCIEVIERDGDKPLARPAIRRLVERRVPGAAEALLGYAPFAGDPAAEEDVWYGLDELAERDPKVLGVLDRGLADAQPVRRALAACILGRRGSPAQKAAVRGLLKDADPTVRLRTAQGLLAGRDKAGLPALIDLLTDGPVEVRWQAEELLRWLAGDQAPDALVGAGDAKKAATCQMAWRAWLTQFGEKADVAAREKEPNRPLLVLAFNREKGRAWLVGCDGTTRWEWTGIERLADAHYVPGGTLLALQSQPVREKPLLSERTVGGTVVWQHDDMRDPASCQRLSNGRVFVAERQDIAEPYLCYQFFSPNDGIVGARPEKCSVPGWSVAMGLTDDGAIVCAWLHGPRGPMKDIATLDVYDPSTDQTRILKLQKSIVRIGDRFTIQNGTGGTHLLSGLVAGTYSEAEIVEVESDGYVSWEYRRKGATAARRMRDGYLLADPANRILEVSRDKRVVGEIVTDAVVGTVQVSLPLCRLGFGASQGNLDLSRNPRHYLRHLTHPDRRLQVNAVERLAELDTGVSAFLPDLMEIHKGGRTASGTDVARLLTLAGTKIIPGLLNKVKQAEPQARLDALTALSPYARAPGALDAILTALEDPDPKVRAQAANVLGATESDSQQVVPPWKELARMRWAADRIVPALVKALGDKDENVRLRVVVAIGLMGSGAKPAVPSLISILTDSDQQVRGQAAISLGQIGPVTDGIIPALTTALSEIESPGHVGCAAFGLGVIGAPAANSLGRLVAVYDSKNLASNEDATLVARQMIIGAIGRIAAPSQSAINLLKRVVQDESAPLLLREHAASALAQIGPAASSAIPDLVRLGAQEGVPGRRAFLTAARTLSAKYTQSVND